MLRSKLVRGGHEQFLHKDGNWSTSRNRETAAAEYRCAQENKMTDIKNIELARVYGYEKFPRKPPNGFDAHTGRARGWTRAQIQEWKDINAHRGNMLDSRRAWIMRSMQQKMGVSPEEFQERVEFLEFEFGQNGYDLDLPDGFSEWPFYAQQDYFNKHQLPQNVYMEPPRIPPEFRAMGPEQQANWCAENGTPQLFPGRPISTPRYRGF
ncbi:hypothetical protein T484DRAFT_1756345 [Baffinella frigidus]|nr:hypothetical protein T484DRAFT_1756345 [Cryptophyta sp. CCMP2293]